MQKPSSAVKHLPTLVLLAPAVCGMLLARLTTADIGAGVSKDSVEYLAAARSLLLPQSGGLLRGYDGGVFILWPPLYPMLLALVEILSGQDALEAAGLLNTLLFGAAILLVSLLIYNSLAQAHISSRLLWSAAAGLALALSPPLYWIAINVLSDLLMIVLVLLFLLAGGRWLSLSADTSPASRIGHLAAMALLAGLASITRYIGVELILLGAILIGFRPWKDHSARDRTRWNTLLREAGVFVVLSLLPLAAWMARNLLLTGLAFGPRAAPRWTVAENLAALASGLEYWVRPLPLWGGLALVAAAAQAGSLLSRSAKRRLSRGFNSPYAWPALLYGLLYLPLLVASQMSTAVTRIDQRLLAPAYFAFVMALVLVLARLPAAAAGRKILPGVVSLLLFAAWLAPQGLTTYQTLLDSRAGGVSVYNYLNTRPFHDSGVTQYLRANPLPANAVISSNYAAVVFLYSGQHASASPFRRHPQNREIQYALETYRGQWPGTPESYLIWYEGGLFEHYFPPQDLAGLADMIPLYQGPDGAVYRVILTGSGP